MSGFSDSVECPNCGKDANRYSDWKPFDYTSITCLHCGLMINPELNYMTLEELNSDREAEEMPRLEELPVQDKSFF